MNYISAKIIAMSELTDEYNATYNTSFHWYEFCELIYGDRYIDGIRYFYFGTEIENETELSANFCGLLRKEFPNDDAIYINTEA